MISAAQVADQLALPNTDEATLKALAPIVAAVNSRVAGWLGYAAADEWAADHVLGAVMLAAHLYRRRNTPGGVEQFNELGVAYVQKSDPHVSMLLGLGAWTKPVVV